MRRALLILVPILMLIGAGVAVAADRSIELRTVAETDIHRKGANRTCHRDEDRPR